MADPRDLELARRLLNPADDEAWGVAVDMAQRMASTEVVGGSRFGPEDVASAAYQRLFKDPQQSLAVVLSGELPLHVVVKRFVKNAYFDLTREHNREMRSGENEVSLAASGRDPRDQSEDVAAYPTQLWAAFIRCNPAIVALHEAVRAIHDAGSTWPVSTPQYPMVLLDERVVVSNMLRLAAASIAGMPADAAAELVYWPPDVGARRMGAITLNEAAAVGDVTDKRLAAAMQQKHTTIQQWRSRGRAKLRKLLGDEWIRDHLPHWPSPAVRPPREARKEVQR